MRAYLLLAHGSRQQDTVKTMEGITEKVKKLTGVEAVRCAFMQFAHPSFEEGLTDLIALGAKDIHIVPYFLFDGVHIHEDIPEMMRAFMAVHPDVSLTLGSTLGADDRLAAIVADRIIEAQ